MLIFHGTEQERDLLHEALNRYCTCEFNELGEMAAPCAGHLELATNQRFGDGLIFDRRIRLRLLHEEFHVEKRLTPPAA